MGDFVVDPKEYGIQEKCRFVVISDVLEPGQTFSLPHSFSLPCSKLDGQTDYRYKIQVFREGKWIDQVNYKRISLSDKEKKDVVERNEVIEKKEVIEKDSLIGNDKIAPYENLQMYSDEYYCNTAEKYLSDGYCINKEIIKLDSITWEISRNATRSTNFHVHAFEMCDALLGAYSCTGLDKYLIPAMDIVFSWCDLYSNGRNKDDSPFIWYDMAVGLRIFRMAYIYDVMLRNKIGSQDKQDLLWNCIIKHKKYLEKDSNIAFHSNHGFYQIIGQLFTGKRLSSYDPMMDAFYNQGQERLCRMLHSQFTDEGIHKENSPDYHRMLLLTILFLLKSNIIADKNIIEFINRIEHCLSLFITPLNSILQFGDSDGQLRWVETKLNHRLCSDPILSYLATQGKSGHIPDRGLKLFPQSGYAFVRFSLSEKWEDFLSSSYLAINAAFHSRTHKHADDFTFCWYDKGFPIIVDSGRYGYVGKTEPGSDLWKDGFWYADPFRIYCESTRAHNTLEFDGRNLPRKNVPMYGSALKRWTENNGVYAIEAEQKIFKSIRRSRIFIFNPANWLIIFDWFHDNAKQNHTVVQWFHTAPGIHMLLSKDNNAYASSDESDVKIYVTSLVEGVSPLPVIRGRVAPEIQGWCSPESMSKIPNDAFGFKIEENSSGSFATLFSFNEAISDVDFSRINRSGRRARFKWKTEEGIYTVIIERPEKGEIYLTYLKI